jgi:molybdopterin synthase catalytic subunit
MRRGEGRKDFAVSVKNPLRNERYGEMVERSLEDMIASVKSHPDIRSAGMLLCHNGFVRGTSRKGETVETLRVTVHREKIEEIRQWALSLPGVTAVEIEAFEGEFKVGDDLLYVVLAGDIRENVFDAMRSTVERLKTEGVSKSERLAEGS